MNWLRGDSEGDRGEVNDGDDNEGKEMEIVL